MKLKTLVFSAPFLLSPLAYSQVVNGEFQMFKPGTNYTVTATFNGNAFARGVGDNLDVLNNTVSYSDGSPDGQPGDATPDIDLPGWIPLQSGNDLVPNGVDGSTGMNLFAAWGGDGRIQSADPVAVAAANTTYTIRVLVGGPDTGPKAGPLAFHLAANGVNLTPTSSVDVTIPSPSAFQEISRTYDASAIASVIGQDLRIVLGVEDANDAGNRVIFDNVTLEVVSVDPPPAFPVVISDGSTAGTYDFT